jgi:choline dehydrogenase-like flavoprotein
MIAAPDCDVLIIGGGPTGVTLGILLAQQGVSTIIAEKEPGIYPLPRAAHIDHESMRILQQAGVAAAVMATCRHTTRYDFLNASGEILLRFDGSDKLGPGSWPAANFIHQPSIETALRAQLSRRCSRHGMSKAPSRSSARRFIASTPGSRRTGARAGSCWPALPRTRRRPLPGKACARACATPPISAGSCR